MSMRDLLERAAKLSKEEIRCSLNSTANILKHLMVIATSYITTNVISITDWANLLTTWIYFFSGIRPAVNY